MKTGAHTCAEIGAGAWSFQKTGEDRGSNSRDIKALISVRSNHCDRTATLNTSVASPYGRNADVPCRRVEKISTIMVRTRNHDGKYE